MASHHPTWQNCCIHTCHHGHCDHRMITSSYPSRTNSGHMGIALWALPDDLTQDGTLWWDNMYRQMLPPGGCVRIRCTSMVMNTHTHWGYVYTLLHYDTYTFVVCYSPVNALHKCNKIIIIIIIIIIIVSLGYLLPWWQSKLHVYFIIIIIIIEHLYSAQPEKPLLSSAHTYSQAR